MNPLFFTEFHLPTVVRQPDAIESKPIIPFQHPPSLRVRDVHDLLNVQEELVCLLNLSRDPGQQTVQDIVSLQRKRIPSLFVSEASSYEELQRYCEDILQEVVDEIQRIASCDTEGLSSPGERCPGQIIQTLAVRQNNIDMIRFLHEKRANWHASDGTGKTAWQIAIDENNEELVVLFLHMLGPDGIGVSVNEQTFLSYFAGTNPALVYEMSGHLPLDEGTLLALRERNPFFSLKERLVSLNDRKRPRFSEVKEELSSFLHSLHDLNTRMGIPRSFYTLHATLFSDVEPLDSFLSNVCITCELHELLELATLINKYYFCGSNWLLYVIYKNAKRLCPSMNEYITDHFLNRSRTEYTPSLTSRGIEHIIRWKLEEKGVHDLFFSGVVYASRVAQTVDDFFRSQKEKGAFLIHFFPGTVESHYASCLMKREFSPDAIRCFYTDSLVSQENYVLRPLSVFQKTLERPPCFIDLYCPSQQRQFGWVGCSAFSISDIFESVVRGENILDQLRASRKRTFIAGDVVEGKTNLCHTIGSFPLPLMKLTQSLSAIKDITKDTPRFLQKGKEISLEEYVNGRTYFTRDTGDSHYKQRNLGCLIKYGKYFERILRMLVDPQQARV